MVPNCERLVHCTSSASEAFVARPVAGAAGWPVRVFGSLAQPGIALLCLARILHQHLSRLQHTLSFSPDDRLLAAASQQHNSSQLELALSFFILLHLFASARIPPPNVLLASLPRQPVFSCLLSCRLHVACRATARPLPSDPSHTSRQPRQQASGLATRSMLTEAVYGNRIPISNASSHCGHGLAASSSLEQPQCRQFAASWSFRSSCLRQAETLPRHHST